MEKEIQWATMLNMVFNFGFSFINYLQLYLVDKLLSSASTKPLKSKAPPATASSRCKGRRMTPASKHVVVSARARRKKTEDLECIEKAEPLTPAKLKHMLETFGQVTPTSNNVSAVSGS